MIDTQVGKLIEALERRGVLDDTVIIFTSDHGDCLNDHGHSQKWTMYEQSVRVPAIVWSARAGSRPAARSTIWSRCSISVRPFWNWRALLHRNGWRPDPCCLTCSMDGTAKPRRYVFAEHAGDRIFHGTEFMTMIRDHDWKLVHFVDSEAGQLFDMQADPQELQNLWADPAHEATRRGLIDEILKWRIRSDLKTQGWTEAVKRG